MRAPAAVEVVNPDGASPLVLLCEHASNFIPARYADLGLDPSELRRHIAWDIGGAAVARDLARRLDAPLFLSTHSRLLIDCNRPPDTPTSIPERSEDTVIPGNLRLDAAERGLAREDALFEPFRDAVAGHLDGRAAAGRACAVVGVHSFTPVFQGEARPWHAGILYAAAADFAASLLDGLRGDPALVVGDNEPYRVEREHDYTVPVHGDDRGLPAALLEIRHDLIADDAGAAAWADRFEPILRSAAARHAAAGRPRNSPRESRPAVC